MKMELHGCKMPNDHGQRRRWTDAPHRPKREPTQVVRSLYLLVRRFQVRIEDFVEKLQLWHENKVSQLRQITSNKDAVIEIGDLKIEPDSDMAKGFRVGVIVSLELLGKMPFSISQNDEDES